MGYPLLAKLVLPYSRLELPGWGKVLVAAGVYRNERWAGAPQRWIRGKYHGYRMRLLLSEWSERQTYFLGRYYDLPTQLFMWAAVRPGETFVDVGGNIGMITLLAARLVGPGGAVHTFEPNPDCGDRIRASLDDNGIRHVTLHRFGVADQPGEFTLSVITEHSGMGTLAPVEEEHRALVSRTHTVQVRRADDLLPADVRGPVTMKMDIEGFEVRALRGMERLLERHRPAIVTEVSEHHLRRAGTSSQELFDLLHGKGYRSYRLGSRHKLLRLGNRLALVPIEKPTIERDEDVAWVHPETPHAERLRGYIV